VKSPLFVLLSCSLLSLSPQLLLWGLLNGSLRFADGRGTSNSEWSEISSVSVLGCGVGNSCVGPTSHIVSIIYAWKEGAAIDGIEIFGRGKYTLSGSPVSTESNRVVEAFRSLGVLRLLGDQSNTSLVSSSGDNSNSLSFISILILAPIPSVDSAYLVVDESSLLYSD